MRARIASGRDVWQRLGLGILALGAAVQGVWALLAPHSFFGSFPGLGHNWVALLPPYNEHLTRDVGAFNLAFAVLFAWAAIAPDHRLTRPVLVSYLAYAIAHLAYHAGHEAGFPASEAVGQTIALGFGLLLPLALLVATVVGDVPAQRGVTAAADPRV